MILYTTPINPELIEDTEGYFTTDNKTYYGFKIEVVDDTLDSGFIRITDSIGRMIPVDFDNLESLTEVLARLVRLNVSRQEDEVYRMKEFEEDPSALKYELDEIRGTKSTV